jgi:hypothetical protein
MKGKMGKILPKRGGIAGLSTKTAVEVYRCFYKNEAFCNYLVKCYFSNNYFPRYSK